MIEFLIIFVKVFLVIFLPMLPVAWVIANHNQKWKAKQRLKDMERAYYNYKANLDLFGISYADGYLKAELKFLGIHVLEFDEFIKDKNVQVEI